MTSPPDTPTLSPESTKPEPYLQSSKSDTDPEQLTEAHRTASRTSFNEAIFGVDPSVHSVDIGPPPDGGLTAWLQVLVSFIGSFNSWGLVNAFGVYQSYYGSHGLLEGSSPGDIAWIGALSGTLAMSGSSFFGFVLDAGYIKQLFCAATVLNCFSLMMLSLSTKYYQIMLTQGLISGMCCSVLFLCAIGAVGPYFSSKRALAMGLGASGSAIGGVVYSVMSRRLFQIVGFAWSTRILAFVYLGLGLVATLLIKRRLPPKRNPAYFAQESFGDGPFFFYALGMFFSFIGLYIFFFHYQAFALSLDPNYNVYLYLTAIINTGSLVGRLIPSYIADKVGPFNVLVPTTLCSIVMAFCWIPVKSKGSVIAVAFIFALVSSPLTALPGTVTAKLTPDLRRLGIRLSFVLLFAGMGILLGAPFAGIMVRRYNGYFWAKIYCAMGWIAASICMMTSYRLQSGGRLFARV